MTIVELSAMLVEIGGSETPLDVPVIFSWAAFPFHHRPRSKTSPASFTTNTTTTTTAQPPEPFGPPPTLLPLHNLMHIP